MSFNLHIKNKEDFLRKFIKTQNEENKSYPS